MDKDIAMQSLNTLFGPTPHYSTLFLKSAAQRILDKIFDQEQIEDDVEYKVIGADSEEDIYCFLNNPFWAITALRSIIKELSLPFDSQIGPWGPKELHFRVKGANA